MADDFSLFTSLRYDVGLKEVPAKGLDYAGWNYQNCSPFYMLGFHRDRMLRAATHWQWKAAIEALSGDDGLLSLTRSAEEVIGPAQETPLRVRIVMDHQGKITVEKFNAAPTALANLLPERLPPPGCSKGQNEPLEEPLWALIVDEADTPRSEYTHFKTTKRAMYDDARQRLEIAPTDLKEVLLINKDDRTIMEGSLTTPYFWRDGKWVTPPVSKRFSLEVGSGGQDGTSRRWALER